MDGAITYERIVLAARQQVESDLSQGAYRADTSVLTDQPETDIRSYLESRSVAMTEQARLDELRDLDIGLQVNGASLFGGVFDSASAVVRKLWKSGRIHFLGTDSHGTHYQKPQIKKAAWIHDNCPVPVAEGILCGNPMAVLEDKLL